jgi:hypothetical protein
VSARIMRTQVILARIPFYSLTDSPSSDFGFNLT